MNAPPVFCPMVAADEAARVRLGASEGTAQTVLHQLANDGSVTVRAALALNPAAPPAVNQSLAQDHDVRVRLLLARKLASLLPTLARDEQTRLGQEAHATLLTLAEDAAVRVRAAVAEVVKDMPDAPRDLILRLAHDPAVTVSEPVIRLSPLLTSADLIALLAGAPSPATVLAVSRRREVDEAVSDAVAETANNLAIQALLANPCAHIRESTLDALVARAVDNVEWHEPLVRRPRLTDSAARALSEFVAAHLLEVLAGRADLTPELSGDLRSRLERRFEAASSPPRADDAATEKALNQARKLAADGALSEPALLDAARQGDVRLVSALLAVAAGFPISVVDRASTLRSAKGLVSLAWKAGFGMRAALASQTVLARLAPEAVLGSAPGGSFPLAIEEMRWQLDFLSRMGR